MKMQASMETKITKENSKENIQEVNSVFKPKEDIN